MNRHERRRAAARAGRPQEGTGAETFVIAIHEAGHAVARYLTAADMGHETDVAIASMELGVADSAPAGRSSDGRATLLAQATTYGPVHAKDMEVAARRVTERHGGGSALAGMSGRQLLNCRAEVIEEARRDGADVRRWLIARATIAVAGAAAECLFTRRPFDEVWTSYQSESDMRSIAEDCTAAGLAADQIDDVEEEGRKRASDIFRRPEVLRALTALAETFAQRRRLDGREAALVIEQALAATARA